MIRKVLQMTMTERVTLLNKLVGDEADPEILQFILGKCQDMILNYCRIKELPAALENVLINMCVDLYRAEQLGKSQVTGAVKSVTEGDVSVTYTSATNVSENKGMEFLKDYTKQLDRYRRMGW